jgi:hypothetical protein
MAGFYEGMRVKVNYLGSGNFFSGKITARNDNNTYDILYDDGEVGKDVIEKLIFPEDS